MAEDGLSCFLVWLDWECAVVIDRLGMILRIKISSLCFIVGLRVHGYQAIACMRQ